MIGCTLFALSIGAVARCWADIKRRRNDTPAPRKYRRAKCVETGLMR